MLRHQQQALGKIEHLALLDRDRRLRIERQTAMPAHARLVRNHEIGLGDLPQRVARVALLAAALLARLAAQTAGRPRLLRQPVARRRLRAVVLSSPKRRRSSATKASSSAIRRSFEANNSWISGGMTIPLLIQIRRLPSLTNNQPAGISFHEPVAIRTHHRLGVTKISWQHFSFVTI